jgi:hypothetical protein
VAGRGVAGEGGGRARLGLGGGRRWGGGRFGVGGGLWTFLGFGFGSGFWGFGWWWILMRLVVGDGVWWMVCLVGGVVLLEL